MYHVRDMFGWFKLISVPNMCREIFSIGFFCVTAKIIICLVYIVDYSTLLHMRVNITRGESIWYIQVKYSSILMLT